MATKILGTKLEYNDLQFLLGLARDAYQRRIIKGLFVYQMKMIEQNGLDGIDNCKQLHNTWLAWIIKGSNPESIVSTRYHHGHKARLQYAQRLYTKYVQEGKKNLARKWRDTVTTVLRSYQVCGPSIEDMQTMWNDSIKNNITQPLDDNSEIAIMRGCCGIPSRYNEPCNAQDVYTCCINVKSYFDMIERVPFKERKGFYRALSSLIFDLNVDDYSLLIKRGPHTVHLDGKDESPLSIFGQGIDMHALNTLPLFQSIIPIERVGNGDQYTDLEVFTIQDRTLLSIVDDLNEAIVDAYKHSDIRRKNIVDIHYAPQIPVGTVPGSIDPAPGRTVLLQDKAGKTRPISIVTYTTNNTLAPLHEQLFKILGRIRQDSTDQDFGINHIKEMTSKTDSYICSADLSSATDRLPVSLQAYILYRVLKLSHQKNAIKIANYWYMIMSGTPFRDPVQKDQWFSYGAGQPMGVYTSWPMLSLTNHILIRVAYYVAHDKSLDYLVCGDDTVIGSKRPFLYYENWMNSMGVKINRLKSHICEKDDTYKVAEFCKRLAVNGEIVSSESPKILIRASRDPAYQPAAIECIHSIIGPISDRKLTNLVAHRIGRRKLTIPYRYGGWGQINSEPFHQVLLEDNFIFIYIYKKMRGSVSALETIVSRDSPGSMREIDSLSAYTDSNPYRQADKDWILMGRKVYTPMNLCQNYLERYEQFITGKSVLTPTEIVECVRETFDLLDKCLIPLKLSSKDDNSSKSRLAIRYQRMFTRAYRNISAGKCHTFSAGIQPISIDINWTDDPQFLDPKGLVESLDALIFR